MTDHGSRFREIFFEVYESLPRQGPGNRDCTERALRLCAGLPRASMIADLGCGIGKNVLNLNEMKLLEDIVLTDSIEIRTTPENIFGFFLQIVDDASYQAWHPEDHVAFRWIRGEPWQQGSVVYAEEYIHGKLHKFKFFIKEVVPDRKIELVPLSRLLRIYFPRNTFLIEPRNGSCVFTASGVLRVGRLAKLLARNRLEQGLSSVRKHMKEEGENLKRLLEERDSHNQKVEARLTSSTNTASA